MTLPECVSLLTPMALALRAEMDDATFRAYYRVLEDVPAQMLDMACRALLQTGIEFMPGAAKLRAECEKARRQWLAANPHEECAECEGQRGWRTVVREDGQRTVERCPCLSRYQERLESAGMLAPLAELPGEESILNEQAYPSVAQLPSGMQGRLRAVLAQKVMR